METSVCFNLININHHAVIFSLAQKQEKYHQSFTLSIQEKKQKQNTSYLEMPDQTLNCPRANAFHWGMGVGWGLYLFVPTVELCPMIHQDTNHFCVPHVSCPVNGTPVFLVEGINGGSLLQQQLGHLNSIRAALMC